MADISKEIKDFRDAVYGREVRGSMISLAEKLNREVENDVANAADAVAAAEQSAAEAKSSETSAAASAAAALASQQAAAASEDAAADSAADAEAWAHGREDHPQNSDDNSKYWSGRSETAAEAAKKQADRAMAYADYVAPDFLMDNNRVYVNEKATVTFAVFDNKMYFKLPA